MDTLFKYQDQTSWMWTFRDHCFIDESPNQIEGDWGFKYGDGYIIKPVWVKKQKVILKNEEEIKLYYGDKTKSVFIDRVTLVVEEKENSIAIKLYNFSKGRKVGTNYYGVTQQLSYVTYNKKYNNFYSGVRVRGKKKLKGNSIKVNNWNDIVSILSNMVQVINDISLSGTESMWLDTKHGWQQLRSSINIFNENLGVSHEFDDIQKLVECLFMFYYKENGFKLPNGPFKFMNIPLSKAKLKKTDSVVEAFMKIYEYRGKKVRTILNSPNEVDYYTLNYLYSLLGVDFFNKLNLTFTFTTLGVTRVISDVSVNGYHEYNELNNSEKSAIVDLCNNYVKNTEGTSIISAEHSLVSLLRDHLRFKNNLKEFDVDVKFKARTKQEFNREHDEWTNTLDSYKNGTIKRNYPDMMVKELQEIIMGPHMDYYPVLLKDSDDYNEESGHQKSCVRTYIESPNSFIISIREGSRNGKERATIEFRYSKGSHPNNVQSLGRFNEMLSNNWNYVLEEIQNRVKRLSELRVIEIPKMKKTFPNGKEVTRQSYWNKKMLVWDNTDGAKDDFFNFF